MTRISIIIVLLCLVYGCEEQVNNEVTREYQLDSFNVVSVMDTTRMVETVTYYLRGDKHLDYKRINEVRQGTLSYYYPTGTKEIVAFYKDGKLDGDYSFYSEEGQLKQVNQYSEGLKNGYAKVYDVLERDSLLVYYINGEPSYTKLFTYEKENEVTSVEEQVFLQWTGVKDTLLSLGVVDFKFKIPYIEYEGFNKDSFFVSFGVESMIDVKKTGVNDPVDVYHLESGSNFITHKFSRIGDYLLYGQFLYREKDGFTELYPFEAVVKVKGESGTPPQD